MNDDVEPGLGGIAAHDAIEHYLDIGRHDLALARAREHLSGHSEDPDVLTLMAHALMGLNRSADAESVARQALTIDPTLIDAKYILGHLAMDNGRHREAESFYLEVLAEAPENVPAIVSYGVLMRKVGDLVKAERLARQALAVDPTNADAHRLLSFLLTEGRSVTGFRAARGHGDAALRFEPNESPSHRVQGINCLRTGHPFAAKRHLREAVRLDPSPETEALFLAADRSTRWCYLPMYYWTLVVGRLPGKQFTVWGIFVATILGAQALGVNPRLLGVFSTIYISVCVYTWLAVPIVKAWTHWRRPR